MTRSFLMMFSFVIVTFFLLMIVFMMFMIPMILMITSISISIPVSISFAISISIFISIVAPISVSVLIVSLVFSSMILLRFFAFGSSKPSLEAGFSKSLIIFSVFALVMRAFLFVEYQVVAFAAS